MKRLAGTDSVLLCLETPSWHQHVGALIVLEPGQPKVTFQAVVASIEARLDWVPKFRWKLKTTPLGLDVPSWVDDDEFDIHRHVRHIEIPSPGGFEEAAAVAGRVMSSQLRRDRPLWELWFLDGLSNGRVAVLLKYHHCLLDGMSAASLAAILMDIEPNASGPLVPAPTPEERSAGPAPSTADVMWRLMGRAAGRPIRLPRYLVNGALKLASGAAEHRRSGLERDALRAPTTPFNRAIGPQRAFSFASVALDDLKALRVQHQVKINDLALALVSGALRSYLMDAAALPLTSLTAGVPVSTRDASDNTLDNQFSAMFVSLATDVGDPVERLQAIHNSAQTAKALHKAMTARPIQSLGEVASPMTLGTTIDAVYRTGLVSRVPTVVNTVVSNVPGPSFPLYMCGAKVAGIYPCSIILEGMGINCTVISYLDRVDFGFIVDPDLVPDPWLVSCGILAALAELKRASGLGPSAAVSDPFGAPEAADRVAYGAPAAGQAFGTGSM